MQKIMSRLSGKKVLFLVPVLVLLAAGCGSSQSANTGSNNNGPATEQTANAPVSPVSTSTTPSAGAAGSTWQGTLKASDNAVKGNYMIIVDSHIIYLKTSRDFSVLIGKEVNVSHTGDINSFSLNDITAK